MRKISNEGDTYCLKGMLVPFNNKIKQPVLIRIDSKLFLPIFSTKEKFDEVAKWACFEFASYSFIDSVEDFADAVLKIKQEIAVHVIADPFITEEKNIRFNLIPFDEEEKQLIENK